MKYGGDTRSPGAPRGRGVQLARLALRLGVTSILVYLILLSVSPQEMFRALSVAARAPLIAGLCAGVVFSFLKVLRWWWLLARMGIACDFSDACYSYLGGMSVGLLTPGRVGEVARSLYLRAVDRTYVSGLALLDKLLDLLILTFAAAVGCAIHGLFETALLLFCVGGTGVLIGIFLRGGAIQSLARRMPLRPVRLLLEQAGQALDRVSGRTLAAATGLAVLAFSATVLQFWLFLHAFGPAPWQAAAFAMPLMVLSNLIPMTVSGVGVREWAAVIFLSLYSVPGAVAVNVALLVFLNNTLGPGLTGALLTPRLKALDPPRVLEVAPPCGRS